MVPYQNLYIYEMVGDASGSREFFREDFVGCWNEEGVSFLFFTHPHDDRVETFIKKRRGSLVSKNVFDYKDWQAGEELKPFRVGGLVISPPWEAVQIEEGETLVHLDPCVVFGTGYHPTTRSCLKALREIYQQERPKKVLDLGTGSGILALAAAKWGAEKVLAIDCNELAVETAIRNALSNGESDRIDVRQGGAEDFVGEGADLVCANLHLKVMESLVRKKGFYEKRWLILSGLFVRDAEDVERQLHQKAIKTFLKLQEKSWLTLAALNETIPGC